MPARAHHHSATGWVWPIRGDRRRSTPRRAGFSLNEVMIVVAILVVLMAILLASLASVRRTANMTTSMSNLQQVSHWMSLYAGDNREHIVPSQFDYTAAAAAGSTIKVRSDPALQTTPWGDLQYQGTWTDILWSENEAGVFPVGGAITQNYRFDSPDALIYEEVPNFDDNVLRSTADNSRNVTGGTGPTPFGDGAEEAGDPGYFAANQFFDSTANGWWTTGQIRMPNRSLYVVDSFAGETIEDEPEPFDYATRDASGLHTNLEVDFRYNGNCLMLFMDGNIRAEPPWLDLDELEDNRQIRVRDLHQRTRTP